MIEFKESKFYKLLQDFFINNNKETFLQMLAEFYNRTEGIIDKNKNQDELIKELRELYIEFNEKGIDENIVREKVNYFVENNVKIKDILAKLVINTNKIEDNTEKIEDNTEKLNINTNSIENINSQLENIDKYNNTINLEKLGIISENVVYNDETNKYFSSSADLVFIKELLQSTTVEKSIIIVSLIIYVLLGENLIFTFNSLALAKQVATKVSGAFSISGLFNVVPIG